jgi:hypothetical protein
VIIKAVFYFATAFLQGNALERSPELLPSLRPNMTVIKGVLFLLDPRVTPEGDGNA